MAYPFAMDLEKLHQAVPDAQEYIAAEEEYDAKMAAANEAASQLNDRLGAVKDGFYAILNEFHLGTDRSVTVKLFAVPAVSEDPEDGEQRAGHMQVTLTPIIPEHVLKMKNIGKLRLPGKSGIDGYTLEFDFIPYLKDNSMPIEHRAVRVGAETKLGDTNKTHEVDVYGSKVRISYPIGARYTKQAAEDLDKYLEHYLVLRTDQTAGLELSLSMIQQAMEDPELNPWVEQTREQRRRAQERAQARLSAVAEQERQARAEEPAVVEAPAKDTPTSTTNRRFWGRGSGKTGTR